jgi:hypothetical protein
MAFHGGAPILGQEDLAVDEMMTARLVPNPNVPVIYADDVVVADIVGPRVRLTMVEFRQIDGEWVRWPVAEIVRPLGSADAAAVRIRKQLAGGGPGH